MSRAAILSIKPVYANQIMAGSKTIELRRSAMGLAAGDVVLVYASAPDQQLAFWFRIRRVESLPVDEMWRLHEPRLGIDEQEYRTYFQGADGAVGLHVTDVHRLTPPVPLPEIGKFVPGFVPPQGLIWLRDEDGPFRQLLPRLSAPLPKDALPQQALPLSL